MTHLHLEDGDAEVLLEVGIRGLGRVQSSALHIKTGFDAGFLRYVYLVAEKLSPNT